MSAISQTTSLNSPLPQLEDRYVNPETVKKAVLVVVSVLMALAFILSYSLGAPWVLPVIFFGLVLAPLFPIGQTTDDQRARILT